MNEKAKCYYCENEISDESGSTIFCENCNATPKSMLKEYEIEKIATDILNKTFKNASENLRHDFYEKVKSYLYEHSQNHITQIMDEAIDLIVGKRWARHRNEYSFKELRAKIYKEHKEEFDKKITEQVVENEIKRYFDIFLTDEEDTGWRYTELENKVINWICENYDKSKILKSKLPKKLTDEISKLKERISDLQDKLSDIENIL